MFAFSKANAALNDDEDNDVEIIWDNKDGHHSQNDGHVDDDNDELEKDSPHHLQKNKPNQRPRTWKDSHDRYCRERHCLRATINQILKDDEKESTYQVSWDLPSPQEVVTTIDDARLRVGHAQKDDNANGIPPSSTSTVVQKLAKSLVNGIFSTALYLTGHGANDTMNDETDYDDDAYRAVHSLSTVVDCNDKIIHVDLTRQCLSCLLEAVSHSKSQSVMIQPGCGTNHRNLHRGPWILLLRSDWLSWARSMIGTKPFTPSIEDTQWLLEVLVTQQHARILQRPNKPDLVLLLPMDRFTTEFQWNKEPDNPELLVSLALFDLEQAKISMERQVDQWTEQVRDCSTKALTYRRQGQAKLALAQMAKRKLLQQHIDTSAMMLLQLEQVQASIEMAQSNQSVVELLSQGSQLLHQLSNETTYDMVDQMQEDLQEAMDQVNHVQERLTMTTKTSAEISDEDLLAELAALTIQHEEKPMVPPPVNPSVVPPVSNVSSSRRTEAALA